jgi:hypothetical protein
MNLEIEICINTKLVIICRRYGLQVLGIDTKIKITEENDSSAEKLDKWLYSSPPWNGKKPPFYRRGESLLL